MLLMPFASSVVTNSTPDRTTLAFAGKVTGLVIAFRTPRFGVTLLQLERHGFKVLKVVVSHCELIRWPSVTERLSYAHATHEYEASSVSEGTKFAG